MFKKLVLVALGAIGVSCAFAQTATVSGGNWSDATIWSNGVPAAATNTTVSHPLILDANITVSGTTYFSQNVTDVAGGSNYSLTLNGTLDVTAGTTTFGGNGTLANGSKLYVRNGATLILGNTDIGNNVTLLVEAGGTLIINGALTNGNNSGTFTIGGMVYVNGNFNNTGNAELIGTGDIITTNALNNNGSSLTFGSSNDCSTGPCSGRNLCSFTNSIASSQTLCSGSTATTITGSTVSSPTYLWETSTSSSVGGFSPASGTNNARDYVPGAPSQTTWIRRKATSGGCTGITVPVQISVLPSNGGWTGATSTNWNTASNWCSNSVPTNTTDVSIYSGPSNMPQISTAANCRSLTINTGATVSIIGAVTLSVYGNVFNNGTFNPSNGTVAFVGSSAQSLTSQPLTFNNVTFNNTAGVNFNVSATVNNQVTLTNGIVNLGGNNLTLGSNAGSIGTLSYANGWLTNGSFTRWYSNATTSAGNARLYPLGTDTHYRPFSIWTPATGPNPGGTIRVSHTDASTTSTVSVPDPSPTPVIVKRSDAFWRVVTGNSLAGGTYFIQGGGAGFGTVGALTDLRLMRASSVVGTNGGTAAGSTVTNFNVIRTGLTFAELSGSSFYVGSINAAQTPLPVTLLSFTGEASADGVLLKWATSMEKNFDHFEIERSADGVNYTYLASVTGRGSLTARTDYTYVDGTAPAGRSYYRLRNVDLDATFDYSNVVAVVVAGNGNLAIYPNPVTDKRITVKLPDSDAAGTLVLLDKMGTPVLQTSLTAGEQEIVLDDSLKPGMYFARVIRTNSPVSLIKLWVE
jgi:hypothetical protein